LASKMATDANPAPKNEESENPNYWQEALVGALRQQRKRNPTIVLCGDQGCGKENLVQTALTASEESEVVPHLLLDYASIPFRDEDNDEEVARVNLWQVSDTSHGGLLNAVVKDIAPDDMCYCVVLDASKPENVKTNFFKWMKFIEETQNKLTEKLSEEEQNKLKEQVSRHIQFWQDPRDTTVKMFTDEEKAAIDTDINRPKVNLGVPLMVVLANARNFGKRLNEAERNELFDTLINYIQKWSDDYGAASFTFLEGKRDQARRIVRYAVHRIQTEVQFRESPSIVVSISNLDEDFLLSPSGFVSPTLLTETDADNSITFEQCFPEGKREEESGKNQKRAKLQAEPDDQVFYRSFMMDLEKAGGSVGKESSTKAPRDSERVSGITPKRPKASRPVRPSNKTKPRRSAKGTGSTQQKEVVQNFFRHLLHNGGEKSGARRPRNSTGGKHKHQEALRALETLASKSKGRSS